MIWADLLLAVLALPALAAVGYLAVLTFASRQTKPPPSHPPRWRFDLVVPAHNEEAGIARTVTNLLDVDYPAGLRRVVVIADNCSDATAAQAEAAGARVLVRHDAHKRGKGYALAHAFGWSQADGFADAVVVIDADTVVTPNLLRAYSARLDAGMEALQADYGVLNADAGWRTRLMTLALAMFHGVRSLGRENLRLSAGLRGNGMCFTTRLLRAHPHQAFSVVEDIEYGLQLGEAGVRIGYVHEARVLGEMVTKSEAAKSQRVRWEAGRAALRTHWAWRLLADGWRKHDPMRIDLAMDLVIPPLTTVVVLLGAGTLAASAVWAVSGHALALSLWLTANALLGIHLLRGWAVSGLGLKAVSAIATAPAYMVWKLWTRLRTGRGAPAEWVRTAREG